MLNSLHLTNFTVFSAAELNFGKNLNVIIGENGTGKSHLLKAAYSGIAVSASRQSVGIPGNSIRPIEAALADKLIGVFRPDALGRLVRRSRGRSKGSLSFEFDDHALDLAFSFSTLAKSEVTLDVNPSKFLTKRPVFLPTRELLTIYPGFVSLYDTTHLPFEETWRDTCLLLGAPLARGPREATIKALLQPIEEAMGGTIETDASGRFSLKLKSGNMEMYLVAEGLRKLATLARLIATGSLVDKGYLFWDEPEANINPRIIKVIARTIMQLANSGIQIFIATHSLFLLRELHILQSNQSTKTDCAYFGLHPGPNGVEIQQGPTMDDIGDIVSLDEELIQSDLYLESEFKI